ncbi:fungal-specific transcription factor domain-containing protein [Truncatella angustata]|uniref:Fungal-specific transcription factor domain-containing protein n=1 Tax=Truncatella angustata TaxID=152316 RepID=A0A9P8ZYZ9_9PEZI|nr:fungal-specific transcription factor domain-containing protein [Truncatella angustata]KAH6655687.1 fungal-specific transcription factor domain-containing protein [Truncatella angustata]
MELDADQLTEAGRPRRRIPACRRCRVRKVKCDNKLPVCSTCEKAGVECDQASSDKLLVRQLETRVKDLEALISIHAPQLSLDGRVPGPLDTASRTEPQPSANRQLDTQEVGASTTHTDRHSPRPRAVTSTFNTPSPSVQSSQIGPEQPLAHEVGLLSLGNAASEPKYLGPSSGFTLARLTYAAISQSQGLPSTAHQSQSYGGTNLLCQQSECVPLPSLAEMRRFVGAYLEVLHPLYPFLQDGKIEQMLEARLQVSGNPTERASLDDAMLFLVAALGARLLEQGRNVNLKSANYFASAMAHVVTIQLQDSIQGVQIMLLLVLASFTFPGGLNAWFLSSTIIASCVDLGLQRRKVPLRHDYQTDPGAEINENIRCATFWSAYSIDRTLCTILGRPLNLRDEAIDIDFPGEISTESTSENAVSSHPNHSARIQSTMQSFDGCNDGPVKRRRIDSPTHLNYAASTFFFRFDRITAEIKLMLYRVAQAPWRFPWPTDHLRWQTEALKACDELLESARETLSSHLLMPSYFRRLLPNLEIKYHQCILLLCRPTPAIPQPSPEACRRCYQSASEILRLHAEQSKFGELFNSWLTAHLVFVSGITFIHCVMKLPDLGREVVEGASSATGQQSFDESVTDCSEVLSCLGKTWSVASDAKERFEKLAALTKSTLITALGNSNTKIGDALAAVGSIINKRGGVTQEPADPLMASGGNADLDTFLGSEFIWEELGDMSTWFDLTWVGDNQNSSNDAR